MPLDAQSHPDPSSPLAGEGDRAARKPGAWRLVAMVLSAGVMLTPVTLALFGKFDGFDRIARLADVLMGLVPSLVSDLVVALPVRLAWRRTTGHPGATAGSAWMTLCVWTQLLALLLFATASSTGRISYDAGLAVLSVSIGLGTLSVAFALVGWLHFGWRSTRPVRTAPALEGLRARSSDASPHDETSRGARRQTAGSLPPRTLP